MAGDYTLKTIPSVRLAAVRATMAPGEFGTRIGEMFDAVAHALEHAPGALATPVAAYAETEAGIDVVVGYANHDQVPSGTQAVTLAETKAVCGVHRGPMSEIGAAWARLHEWVRARGYTPVGPSREVYLVAESEDQRDWVTELQQPVLPG